jgi:hypothetical protein
MKKSIKLLEGGFESSCSTTPEFASFFRTFKKEFTKELQTIGATEIEFSRGHFHLTGFFRTTDGQLWYFSLSDVRGMSYGMFKDPDSCMNKLLYRTAKHNKDWTGGSNRYAKIESGMAKKMCWVFQLID